MSSIIASQFAPWLALMALAQGGKGKGKLIDVMPRLVELGIWGGITFLLLVLAMLVVRKLRESAIGNQPQGGELLSNFQEMKQEGDISDAEFRNIKAVLGNQLRSDVKSGKKTA